MIIVIWYTVLALIALTLAGAAYALHVALKAQREAVLYTDLIDIDDEDAWEQAKEDRDYMYSTGMSEAEMRAEMHYLDEMDRQRELAGGMDFNADEKGYS